MKIHATLIALALCQPLVQAQTRFTIADLPSQPGDYYRAYVLADESNVAGRLGVAGGPQQWNFAEPKSDREEIRRMDIVPPSDAPCASDFPNASYAERVTRENNGKKSWSFYKLLPGQGRMYYGFCDPIANPAKPTTIFDQPTIDI